MNWNKLTPQEAGRSAPKPGPANPEGLPPGNHEWVVPHFETFSSIGNSQARAYQMRFDNALRASAENAWRMRLDPIIDTCLEVRVTPSALLPISVKPADDSDPRQVAAAKRQQALLRRMPRRAEYRRWLLKEGLFVGRAGSQIVYSWTKDAETGRLMCYPSNHRPVYGDKLQFKWDGSAGLVINPSSELASHARTERLDGAMCYFPSPTERQGLVVHRSFAEDADYMRPWLGGSVNGTGLRSRLYWAWAMKNQLWGMSLDFLQWFAKGLTVYFFEWGNDAHRQAIQEWVNGQDGNSAMMYPVMMRNTSGGGKEPYFPTPLQHIPVPTTSPQFLQTLITEYLDDIFRFAILHQSLTTTTGATGLGSNVADAHQTTFDQVVKMDATMLDETETLEILSVMYATNEPGIPCGTVMSQVDSPNVGQLLEVAEAVVNMGGSVAAEPILEAGGIPEAKPGDTLLGNVQPGQPVAVGAVPEGVPLGTSTGDPNQPPVG